MSNRNTPKAAPINGSPSTEAAPHLWASTKIHPSHLDRLAIVYVRQSTPQQVIDHQESLKRQYALVDLAVQLGWSAQRVEVIDEDQGHSGSTAEGRPGFHRLLAEVGLDHVGLILGIEMSRLARSNKDWHQLIELCGIFRTLLADQDGLYDPTDYNDRLLLGLRGMMNEAELHILQGRMYQAMLNKARRGELYILPPVGYIKLPSGEFALDPDEQVQGVVRLVFDVFDQIGTMRGVLRYLIENAIQIPIRPHAGTNRGNLEWRSPTRDSVNTILNHPIYAGTYRYGHRQVDPRKKKPGQKGSGKVVRKPLEYHALIADHCPAYISQERYERNQRVLQDNQIHAQSKGPPREGPSLLGGLLFCRRCDRRMGVHYSGKSKALRYVCWQDLHDCKGPLCQGFSGTVLDELVAKEVLRALEPASLQVSLGAAEDLQQERLRLEEHWQQQLERARYDVTRAEKQYQTVDCENRLVARELERRWETALKELQQLEQQYARFRQSHPCGLTEEQRQAIVSLSENLPGLWQAPTTTSHDRQRIVRLLLERVVVNAPRTSNRVEVSLHWKGGFCSDHQLIRPVFSYRQLPEYDQLISRMEQLREQGESFAQIADRLNEEGFRPVKQAEKFHGDIVNRLLNRHQNKPPTFRRQAMRKTLPEDQWFVVDLADELQMPKNTLFAWIKQGWVHVVRRLPGYRGRLICFADEPEFERLRQLRQTPHGWWDTAVPQELTTPKVVSGSFQQEFSKPTTE